MHLIKERLRRGGEDGYTLIELMVGLGMGMVVLAGIATLLIGTVRGSARVGARVESTDNARLVVTRIIEELHSSCVTPKFAPIQKGSTGERLIFWHEPYGREVAPGELPIYTEIVYSGAKGTLTQIDRTDVGTLTELKPSTSSETRILASNVGPATGTTAIFTYYKDENGTFQGTYLPTPLTEPNAEATILVNVKLQTSPRSLPVADNGASTTIENGVTLRLTPPEISEESKATPCQ
jgi:hypothetical protein